MTNVGTTSAVAVAGAVSEQDTITPRPHWAHGPSWPAAPLRSAPGAAIDSSTVELWSVVLAVAGLVLVAVGWLVLEVVGRASADGAREAIFQRPGLRERRGRARGWLISGYVSLMASVATGLYAAAAFTSGDAADENAGQ